ncbi:P63C domain protein [Arcobacter porcinus]|uniref:P63C domain-containing protein n=1 Tax=Arcobacter porcinus TaxID=1935204 RepID=UPI0008261ADD|nr:P63C domain-containing protein [Arcobacter porcinus]OCL82068.1 P63C domain protein [Arcobacter porcinus]
MNQLENGYIGKVTHQGKWKVYDEFDIDCYVTDNGIRLLSLRGTARALDIKGNGSGGLLRNLQLKWIQPYLSDQLKEWVLWATSEKIKQIDVLFGPAIIPFKASFLVDICKAYILANNDKALLESQMRTYYRLISLMTAFAKVGIEAMVDEITGYQEDRRKDELQKILKLYIHEEFLEWTKMFPEEFYEQIFRLKKWGNFKKAGQKMPQVVGLYTNDIVYERLPDRVLVELKKKVKKSENGNNLVKLHQGLSKDYGVSHLERHLIAVIALMKASVCWEHFLEMLDKTYKKSGQSVIRLY